MTSETQKLFDAHLREVSKLSKGVLAQMHVRNGGLMGYRNYMQWTKEELVNTVMQDWVLDGMDE